VALVLLGGGAMPRRVYLLGVGLALVALALAVTDWALSLRPGVTETNAKRIRVGMTAEKVETILGRPDGCAFAQNFPGGGLPPEERYQILENGVPVRWLWRTGRGEPIVVLFTETGLVTRVDHPFAAGGGRSSLLDRLRSWLGW